MENRAAPKGRRDERRRYGSSGRARASDSVAEVDERRFGSFPQGNLWRTKREPVTPTKSGAQDARAGAHLGVVNRRQLLVFGNETGNAAGAAVRDRNRSWSSGAAKPRSRKTLGSSSAHRRNSFRITRFASPSRELEATDLGLPLMQRPPLEKVEPAPEAGDETREAKRHRAAGTNNSRGKKRTSRGSDRRRRETHRSSRLRIAARRLERTGKTKSTGAVGQVVGGIRRQHASRRSPEARHRKVRVSHVGVSAGVKLARSRWRALRDWPRRNGVRSRLALRLEERPGSECE